MNLADLLFGEREIELGEPQPQYGEAIQSYLDGLENQSYFKDLLNRPSQTGLTPEQYKMGITQGLNYGVPEIAQAQQQLGIKIPVTGEDKYNASIGEFNKYPVIRAGISGTPREGGLLNDLAQGFRDNYNNRFSFNNLAPQGKNWATRIGEGLGTVGRFIDSPLGRGLIAGGLNSALGYSNSLGEGLTAAVGRQNAQTEDRLYRNMLKTDFGFTDDELNQITGNIRKDAFNSLALSRYRQQSLKVRQDIANATDNTKRANIIMQGLNNGTLTPQEAQLHMANYGITLKDLQKSNATRNAEINEYLAPAKAEAYRSGAMAGLMNAATNQGRLGLQKAEFVDKVQSRETGDKTIQRQIQENAATLSDIDAGLQAIENNPNAYSWIKGKVGADIANRIDPKGVATRTQIDNITAVYRKWLTGAQMSDAERKAYERFLPAPSDNAQIVKAKLQGMKNSIERKNKVLMQGTKKQQDNDPLGIL